MGKLTSATEVRDILIAWIVLTVAFSLVRAGGASAFQTSQSSALSQLLYLMPIMAIGVALNFILHELMHKFFAQRYGALAEFRMFPVPLVMTLITSASGFLIGLPGATMIYASNFTKRENGIVSLAGPLTNFAVFGAFFAMLLFFHPPANSFFNDLIVSVLFISIILAFFNMLPIFPLDGSKVLDWSKPVYIVSMAAIFIIAYPFIGWQGVLLFIAIAMVLSLVFRFLFGIRR